MYKMNGIIALLGVGCGFIISGVGMIISIPFILLDEFLNEGD
jgi:hypothetical protein